MSTSLNLTPEEKHRRAKLYARMTYVTIVLVFLTVCSVAVISTMEAEKNKEGFRAIELSKPISFFDYTYVKDQPKDQPVESTPQR